MELWSKFEIIGTTTKNRICTFQYQLDNFKKIRICSSQYWFKNRNKLCKFDITLVSLLVSEGYRLMAFGANFWAQHSRHFLNLFYTFCWVYCQKKSVLRVTEICSGLSLNDTQQYTLIIVKDIFIFLLSHWTKKMKWFVNCGQADNWCSLFN